MTTTPAPDRRGPEKLLWGSVLGLLTFWLFAGTMGNVARSVLLGLNGPYGDPVARTWDDPALSVSEMNLAVAITALFSGLFIVVAGGIADRVGRVRTALAGNVLGLLGSALVVFAGGAAALPLMLTGRCLQGLAGACIMPSTLALVKTYWDGAARQRAVSIWTLGTFGGSSLAALVGGFIASSMGWRYICVFSMVASVLSIALIWGTPESRAENLSHRRVDAAGIALFIVAVLSLMVVVIFGRTLGWTSPTALLLLVLGLAALAAFVVWERRVDQPFIEFDLFRNRTYSGAVLSNFCINMLIGMLLVSQQGLQLAWPERFDAWHAGLLTLGFAVVVISCIRVGEKLLQVFGPRKPMAWACLILAVVAVLLGLTNLPVGAYMVVSVVAYALFGLGLAVYATPSTDAALSNLPQEFAGAGAGIYKMASSLGSAVGAAASLTLFAARMAGGHHLGGVLAAQGAGNAVVRGATTVTMGFNLVLALVALASVLLTVPRAARTSTQR